MKKFLSKLNTASVKSFLINQKFILKLKNGQRKQKKILKNAQKKNKIKIAFLLMNESFWKYDRLYFLFKNDSRFEPVVFICPFKNLDDGFNFKEMKELKTKFSKRGYEVKETFKTDKTWLDIKNDFQPQIVFFSYQWSNISHPKYNVLNFLDIPTCYVPYGFNSVKLFEKNFNLSIPRYCRYFFVETQYHQSLSKQYTQTVGANNAVVTGYPGIDLLIDKNYQPKDCWKPQNKTKKRIIWAPHHTINEEDNLLNFSTFLNFYDLMFKLANEYREEIQICFKPHPVLRRKLSLPEFWGVDKTNEYYNRWNLIENGQLEEGFYIDLFLTSNGMIHDCGSFLIEYLYTNKPVMFLMKSDEVINEHNDLGKKALESIQLGYSEKEIRSFIENVINEKDDCADKRKSFYKDYLIPPGNKIPSENIYEYMLKELNIN